jgi:4-coumarate--CoA ligase
VNQTKSLSLYSAYITPSRPLSSQEASSFALGVQDWVSQRVAPYKRLRGGVVIIDKVPKRSGLTVISLLCRPADEAK